MNIFQRRQKTAEMNKKVYDAVKSGKADANIRFADFRNLLIDLGFERRRQESSHLMYYNRSINEFMNIQEKDGKAKDYQVRQLRKIIKKHNL